MRLERRGPTEAIALVRGKETRLKETSTTGTREHIEALSKTGGDGLPEKLSLLRQKLSQKAKQEPKFGFMRCMTESIGAMCWRRHGEGCEPTRERPAWTAFRSNRSKRRKREARGSSMRSRNLCATGPMCRERYGASTFPKLNGKQRPLGIATVRDRVIQMATLLIVEPIFEADFEGCSYGFRPGRSAHQALEDIRGHIKAGYQAIYDAKDPSHRRRRLVEMPLPCPTRITRGSSACGG
jgi:RNA-directed DNA polymerase